MGMTMDATSLIERLKKQEFFEDQVIHVQELPERPPVYGEVKGGINEKVSAALAAMGIEKLYSHQAAAIEHSREGRNVVIVTGTASGKTLCYTVPVMEALIL